jgi:hypothetical protein
MSLIRHTEHITKCSQKFNDGAPLIKIIIIRESDDFWLFAARFPAYAYCKKG